MWPSSYGLLSLGLNTSISLLGNGKSDSLSTWKRHPRLVAFANHEDIVEAALAQHVSKQYNVERRANMQKRLQKILICRNSADPQYASMYAQGDPENINH